MTTSSTQTHSHHSGFTLIELLVVIAIIGILSAVVLASLQSARQKGYAAVAATDSHTITTALQLYYDDNKTWPLVSLGVASSLSASQWSSFMTALHPYLAHTILPPPFSGYRYSYGAATPNGTPVQSVVFDTPTGYYACITVTDGYWTDFLLPQAQQSALTLNDGGIDPWGIEVISGTYTKGLTRTDCQAMGF